MIFVASSALFLKTYWNKSKAKIIREDDLSPFGSIYINETRRLAYYTVRLYNKDDWRV